MGSITNAARRALTGLLLVSLAFSPGYGQQAPLANDPPQEPIASDPPPEPVTEIVSTTALELSKADEMVELLTTSYAANLALETAVRTAGCTQAEPACAPLFFAQDVILGPWNFVKLMRVLQELPDTDVSAIAQPRDYKTPTLRPAGVLPPEIVSLAEYAMEQQVTLLEHLEAWQITMERYSTALGSNDEPAAAAQRRALDENASKASTAAAGVNAASVEFLEHLTPFIRQFASAISLEDAEAAKLDIQEHGFGPELRGRLAALGIGQSDSDNLRDEIAAMSDATPVDLLDGLTGVTSAYDRIADLMTVPTDASGNLRPLANAGPNQAVPANNKESGSVTLNGSGSTDPEASALTYTWVTGSITASGHQPTITLPLGTHYVALTVSDGRGGTDVDIVTVTVADSAAPLITGMTATPAVLWPPNRQLVAVAIDVKVVDNDDPQPFCQVISVGVNSPANDAKAEPDIVLDGNLTVLLRADPSGAQPGRAYTVTVQCTDKTNHSSLDTVFVPVSH